jgi:hypothetical protein
MLATSITKSYITGFATQSIWGFEFIPILYHIFLFDSYSKTSITSSNKFTSFDIFLCLGTTKKSKTEYAKPKYFKQCFYLNKAISILYEMALLVKDYKRDLNKGALLYTK